MAQHGSILRLYALSFVIQFLGVPLCACLRALEFTAPIFWSYLAMTIFAMAFAVPLTRMFGLNGTMLGIIGTQVLSQSIIGHCLFLKSRSMMRASESCAEEL
jgi:O-antigen/teichoic acid export membrane protein